MSENHEGGNGDIDLGAFFSGDDQAGGHNEAPTAPVREVTSPATQGDEKRGRGLGRSLGGDDKKKKIVVVAIVLVVFAAFAGIVLKKKTPAPEDAALEQVLNKQVPPAPPQNPSQPATGPVASGVIGAGQMPAFAPPAVGGVAPPVAAPDAHPQPPKVAELPPVMPAPPQSGAPAMQAPMTQAPAMLTPPQTGGLERRIGELESQVMKLTMEIADLKRAGAANPVGAPVGATAKPLVQQAPKVVERTISTQESGIVVFMPDSVIYSKGGDEREVSVGGAIPSLGKVKSINAKTKTIVTDKGIYHVQ